jgi:Ca2+/Na+ antiporter
LAVIFVSSQIFVHQLDAIGPMLGLSSAITALLLSPIATELPETMNAIIWVRQGKIQLALANISGAMMIQAVRAFDGAVGAIETAPISPRLVQSGSQLCAEERRTRHADAEHR